MTSPLPLSTQKEHARECLNTNRVEDALALYAQILTAYPEDMDALLALGDCYLAAEQIPAALKLYRRAAGIDPKHPELQRRLVLVQLEQEDQLQGAVNGNLIGQEAVARLAGLLGGGIRWWGGKGMAKADCQSALRKKMVWRLVLQP